MRFSSTVPSPHKNTPIVDYLSGRFSYLTSLQWREQVVAGNVFCNDVQCSTETTVHQNDVVACEVPVVDPEDWQFDYKIVHEDKWLLGIDKPPGLVVHATGKFMKANLIYHLRFLRQPAFPEASLVNRLDMNTSGVMVIARSVEMVREMHRIFAAREVDKTYFALVHGVPDPPIGTIDLPLGKMVESKLPYRYGFEKIDRPKQAVTHYRLIEQIGDDFSLLELKPETGRTHQLRIHLAAIGHIIVGEKLYSMTDDEFIAWKDGFAEREFLLPRHALHCARLRFTHPKTESEVVMEAPLPADMNELMAKLKEQ